MLPGPNGPSRSDLNGARRKEPRGKSLPILAAPKLRARTEFQTILASVDDRLGRLTLNQPENLNPLGSDVLTEIAEAATWMDAQGASVVIVTGAGDRAFSSGFDLREFADPTKDGPSGAVLGFRMADALEGMDAVSIAAIHGHCIGGGVVLAAACDLRVAADDTRFSIPEVDLGIPLAWGGIPRLVREIGPAATRELVMTCRPFDAEEARSLGFVNRVVPRSELSSATDELAQTLLAKAPALIRATKRQVQTASEDMASTQDGWVGEATLAAALGDPVTRAVASRYLRTKGH